MSMYGKKIDKVAKKMQMKLQKAEVQRVKDARDANKRRMAEK
jgi:hypothetical protein